MKNEFSELNEMQVLERNIINRYNELLKAIWQEGDMDLLGRVITEDAFRYQLLEKR